MHILKNGSMASIALLAAIAGLVPAFADDPQPVRVLPAGSAEPQLAVSPRGGVFVVAAGRDLIAITSSTDGKAFGKPALVARPAGLALGTRTGPRIAATSKALVVSGVAELDGKDGELLSWRSTDEGATWKGPVRVNGKSGSAGEGLVGIGAGPKDEVAVAWLDVRNSAPEVYAAVSTDSGETWRETLVYRSPDGHVCECCHPSVAWTPKGEFAIMWRNWLGGSRDMWVTTSKDGGRTFGDAQKLGTGTWPLNRCPTDGGALVVGLDGSITASWTREDHVFAGSIGKEQSLGSGAQSWSAIGPGGVFTVWVRDHSVVVHAPGDGVTEPRKLAMGASPVAAGALDGKGPVVASWVEESGVFVAVLAPRSRP